MPRGAEGPQRGLFGHGCPLDLEPDCCSWTESWTPGVSSVVAVAVSDVSLLFSRGVDKLTFSTVWSLESAVVCFVLLQIDRQTLPPASFSTESADHHCRQKNHLTTYWHQGWTYHWLQVHYTMMGNGNMIVRTPGAARGVHAPAIEYCRISVEYFHAVTSSAAATSLSEPPDSSHHSHAIGHWTELRVRLRE